MFIRTIIGFPYEGNVSTCIVVNIKRTIAEEKNIDKFLAFFQRRTVAITKNIAVTIPDAIIKIPGTVEFPSRSSAEDKTDNMYVPIPKIASILFFILFYYTSRSASILR